MRIHNIIIIQFLYSQIGNNTNITIELTFRGEIDGSLI